MKRSRIIPTKEIARSGKGTLSWSYTLPLKGYARFCGSCNKRTDGPPSEDCKSSEHPLAFKRALELRLLPAGRTKARDGKGWTRRIAKYERPACGSCGKKPNCVPSKTCLSEKHRAYYEKTRAILKAKHWKSKIGVITLLGGRCIGCGITDIRLLQVNHVDHDGRKEPFRRSTTKFFNWILKGKIPRDRFDLRCANCNVLYEYETGRVAVPKEYEELAQANETIIQPTTNV